jgi:predicted dehydrogenase
MVEKRSTHSEYDFPHLHVVMQVCFPNVFTPELAMRLAACQDIDMTRKDSQQNRRDFVTRTATGFAAASLVPYFTGRRSLAGEPTSKNDRINFALVGCGNMGRYNATEARKHGDVVAVCDVDSQRRESAANEFQAEKSYEHYRELLDRKDIDVIICATPDHWHSRILVDSILAGKDVYCEKPLTLTIEEGQLIRKAAGTAGQVINVGTQQRSRKELFLTAIALVQDGRLGDLKRIQCAIGDAPSSAVIPVTPVPESLNWDVWQGQTASTEYRADSKNDARFGRTHHTFRWWYEYSGGTLTDWGAHHVDIGVWAMGHRAHQGPVTISGTATLPIEMKDGYPVRNDMYNTPTAFHVTIKFPDGLELVIRSDTDQGVLLDGTKGRLFVNRGRISGAAVEALQDAPLPEDALRNAYKGIEPHDDPSSHVNHWRQFVDCLRERREPISDIVSHIKALNFVHAANISLRLNRELVYDPEAEKFVGDDMANAFVARERRKGYEIDVG